MQVFFNSSTISYFEVFLIAAFAILLYVLLKKLFAPIDDNSQPDSANEQAVSATVYTPNDQEIVAVIAAAIAMAESEENGIKFRVVSFRRK